MKPETKQPANGENGNGDAFPTIRKYWPDVASNLLEAAITELPDGINVGFILYGEKDATIKRLGFESSEEFKRKAALKSCTDFDGTLGELLNKAIELSPGAPEPPATPTGKRKKAGAGQGNS